MHQAISANPTVTDFAARQATWQDDESALRAIRETVFIREQHVPEELEWDGLDAEARHWLVTTAQGEAVATARLLANGHIGRMAVLAAYRGMGIGSLLLQAILSTARQLGMTELFLNAQVSALGFYEKSGFIAEGDIFDDAGIPHRRMRLPLQATIDP